MIIVFIRYFCAVVWHKFCILLAGIRMNRILSSACYKVSYKRLFLHDLSKFSRSEFWPYAHHFYGDKTKHEEFHQAWLHHVYHNDHHWEHFIENYPSVAKNLSNNNNLIIHEMPDDAILEMVADNLAATRSYEGYWPDGKKKDGWNWMTNSFDKYRLHPITKIKFSAILCALGYAGVLPKEFDWTMIDKINLLNEEKNKISQLQKLAKLNN